MFVTDKLNIGAQTKSNYVTGNAAQLNEKVATEGKNSNKEAELILSDSAKQKVATFSEATETQDIWREEYNYTPQEAQEQVRVANERILSYASESVLAQANQDANKVAELLSA